MLLTSRPAWARGLKQKMCGDYDVTEVARRVGVF
jgi:hypothetical protein